MNYHLQFFTHYLDKKWLLEIDNQYDAKIGPIWTYLMDRLYDAKQISKSRHNRLRILKNRIQERNAEKFLFDMSTFDLGLSFPALHNKKKCWVVFVRRLPYITESGRDDHLHENDFYLKKVSEKRDSRKVFLKELRELDLDAEIDSDSDDSSSESSEDSSS